MIDQEKQRLTVVGTEVGAPYAHARRDLTLKQARFVMEYLKDQNATQAAIRAGYSGKHVDSVASRLVRKSQVRAAIDSALEKVARKVEVTLESLLEECEEARKTAAADTDGRGMVSATELKAKLTGHLDRKLSVVPVVHLNLNMTGPRDPAANASRDNGPQIIRGDFGKLVIPDDAA